MGKPSEYNEIASSPASPQTSSVVLQITKATCLSHGAVKQIMCFPNNCRERPEETRDDVHINSISRLSNHH
jgi:hypothetical protein